MMVWTILTLGLLFGTSSEAACHLGDAIQQEGLQNPQKWEAPKGVLVFGMDASGQFKILGCAKQDIYQMNFENFLHYFLDERFSQIKTPAQLRQWKKDREALLGPIFEAKMKRQAFELRQGLQNSVGPSAMAYRLVPNENFRFGFSSPHMVAAGE